ncbi:MAG: cation:proton antiporter [Thiohalocapsa sp.]|nr:cation:proton antiporter [Thiohalocapsa sp.]
MIEMLPFYAVLLALAVALEPLAVRLRLPFAALLVLLGFAGSEVWVALGQDAGLRWHLFEELVFYVLLPVLVFQAAYTLDARALMKNLVLILFLALPLMLLAAGITAALLYYGIGHPSGFPWMAALIAGVLLSATDPAAVLDLLKRINAPRRLQVILDGESLFNDVIAIVLFSLLIALATGQQESADWTGAGLSLLVVLCGGIAVGAAIGGAGVLLGRLAIGPVQRGVVTLVAAYGSVAAAVQLGFSAVIAVLCAGLLLGRAEQGAGGADADSALSTLWRYNAWLANSLLFLVAGISFQVVMFTDQWLAMLIGIAAVLAARAVIAFLLVPALERLPGTERLPGPWHVPLWWGGTRGAVTLALALSLPLSLDYWWTVQSIAYGVVLWSLLVQAGTMPLLVKKLGS